MIHDLYEELAWRGMIHQATDANVATWLAQEARTAYVGFDATADSLHIGHLVGIVALKRLALGDHCPIAVLGGGTSLIGDPSFKAEERPLLDEAEIEANAAAIGRQLKALLGSDGLAPGDQAGDGQLRIVNNADWLRNLGLTEFLRDTGKHFSVNALMAKDAVRTRLTTREQGISFTEFSYPLLQAYDFLHLFQHHGCTLQLGGSDQWGNIAAGIDLIRRRTDSKVFGLTWPLLTKADGTKFGKTETGTVWLDARRTSPYAFYQYWLRTDDADTGRLLRLLTFLGRAEIERLEQEVLEAPQRRGAARALAVAMTTAVHGADECARVQRAARSLYEGDLAGLDAEALGMVLAEAPSTLISRTALADPGLLLVEALTTTGLVPSRTGARTALVQGAVAVNGAKATDLDQRLGPDDLVADAYIVLRKGKRHYHLLRVD